MFDRQLLVCRDDERTCSDLAQQPIAEFERDLLVERTQEGLAAARARGRKGGRPSVLTPNKVATARRLIDAGELSITQIAEVLGCSRATLYRHPDLAPVLARTATPGRRPDPGVGQLMPSRVVM